VEGQEFGEWLGRQQTTCRYGCLPVVTVKRSWRSLFLRRVTVRCLRCRRRLRWDGVPGDDQA
jgi:hypothetical protein